MFSYPSTDFFAEALGYSSFWHANRNSLSGTTTSDCNVGQTPIWNDVSVLMLRNIPLNQGYPSLPKHLPHTVVALLEWKTPATVTHMGKQGLVNTIQASRQDLFRGPWRSTQPSIGRSWSMLSPAQVWDLNEGWNVIDIPWNQCDQPAKWGCIIYTDYFKWSAS